jgi:hypothetical protein
MNFSFFYKCTLTYSADKYMSPAMSQRLPHLSHFHLMSCRHQVPPARPQLQNAMEPNLDHLCRGRSLHVHAQSCRTFLELSTRIIFKWYLWAYAEKWLCWSMNTNTIWKRNKRHLYVQQGSTIISKDEEIIKPDSNTEWANVYTKKYGRYRYLPNYCTYWTYT